MCNLGCKQLTIINHKTTKIMGRIPKSKPREHVEPDSYPATCVGFIDMGTHETSWKGKPKQTHLCKVAFEIDDMETEEGEPFVYYKTYTFSGSNRSRFMKDLKSWLGVKDGDFDPDEMLGEPALISIEENEGSDGNLYMNVGPVTKLPKKMKIGEPREELVSLYLDDTFDEDVYNALPEWLQNKIAESPEYEELMEPSAKKKAAKAKSKRKNDEEEEEEDEPKSKKRVNKKQRDEEEEEEEEEEEDETEEEDEEEEDERPKRKKSSSKSKSKKRDEEEEEEEDENEEEEEDERPRKRNVKDTRKSGSKKDVLEKRASKTFKPKRR